MNKKINLLLVGLLVFCISFISVQAKATYPKVILQLIKIYM